MIANIVEPSVVPEALQDVVYVQERYGLKRSEQTCSHRVWGWLQWNQCLRSKPKHEIHGFRFCTQHAKMVRKRLEEK